MNHTLFALALLLLAGLGVFVFYHYPKSWRNNRLFLALVLFQHILGTLALGMILTVYRFLPWPWLKWIVSRVGTLYYVVIMMLTIFFGLRWVCSTLYCKIMRWRGLPIPLTGLRLLTDKRTHSIVFFLLSYLLAVTGFINIGILHQTSYDITIHKASAHPDLNVVLIADTHCGAGTWGSTYDRLAEHILAADPDLLLIAGDVFDETTSAEDVARFRGVIERVHPPYGIYFIYGNHDDYREDWAAETLRDMGVQVLEDEMAVVAGDIQLLGRLDPKNNRMDLQELLDRSAPDPDRPLLILTHRPTELRRMAELGCDLSLSGHTHGFNIPQFMAVGLASDMYYGLRAYGNMTAVVTSGVSAWGFHYKWPAKSEVVTLHLHFDGAA